MHYNKIYIYILISILFSSHWRQDMQIKVLIQKIQLYLDYFEDYIVLIKVTCTAIICFKIVLWSWLACNFEIGHCIKNFEKLNKTTTTHCLVLFKSYLQIFLLKPRLMIKIKLDKYWI